MSDATPSVSVLLSAPRAAQLLEISERRFHELRREANFPEAVLLGARCVRWHREELVAYAKALPRATLLPEPRHLRHRVASPLATIAIGTTSSPGQKAAI
jgi:predicted DNA-binding transcriptional regulator AlpA